MAHSRKERPPKAPPSAAREISASDLKNAWHECLDRVFQAREEIVITRYGRPIATLSPYRGDQAERPLFGCLAGTVTVHGDFIAPIDETWDADG